MTELKFNIGKSRSEFIGSLVNAVTNQFIHTKIQKDQRNVLLYYTYEKALFLELQTWIEDTDEIDPDREENIQERIETAFESAEKIIENNGWMPDNEDTVHGTDAFNDIMEELVSVQKNLSILRKEIGLDIPSSSDVDPESVAVDNLRD